MFIDKRWDRVEQSKASPCSSLRGLLQSVDQMAEHMHWKKARWMTLGVSIDVLA